MEKKKKFKEIKQKFEKYPLRDYPLEPIYDKKNKRYLDPNTKKVLDPKKPWILPLKKKKKKRRKKKKNLFEIPEWAVSSKEIK